VKEPAASTKPQALPAPCSRSCCSPRTLDHPKGACLSFPCLHRHPRPRPRSAAGQSGLTQRLSRANPITLPRLRLCYGVRVVTAMPPTATPILSSPPRVRAPHPRGHLPGERGQPQPHPPPHQGLLPAGVPNRTSPGHRAVNWE